MKKGFALITVLAVLIMIALGTAAVLQSVGSQTNLKSINVQEVKEQFLSEAGMQYALWRSRNGANPASENYTVMDIDGTTPLGDVVIIKAETASGSGIYKIKVCVGSGACTF